MNTLPTGDYYENCVFPFPILPNNDLYTQFKIIDKQRNEQKKEDELAYNNSSKSRLENVIITKFNTTFIGALDSFEKRFGYLWNHGKPFSELTDNQKDFRDLWNEVRNDVLNRGNSQLRNALAEIDEYSVVWNKKQYTFKIEENNG